ncbi:MAG: hypothetical protein HPY85_01540 [Anaerolineae bacterium]|nr:hypothetical protein [Anaerolineae bacterium]
MDLKKRKDQVDRETLLRWGIASFFWLASCGFVIIIGQRFWTMLSYYVEFFSDNKYNIAFTERAFSYLLALVVGAFFVFLFFKFLEPMRQDEKIFLIEDHPYFALAFYQRIELLRILKLFLIVSSISLGAWLVTWVSILVITSMAG